ncbi:MAG: cytochrome-c peroxidase, partial [Gammaproteobacteria bacterium]|nr:cytochrome-c peroxidase [Gammaproteobacteria bacterium]
MSSNKHTLKTSHFINNGLQLLIVCAINMSVALAETTTETQKQEPISPIPQKIQINAEKAEIGEQLFFDTRLSEDNDLACATCHQLDAGGDDNVALGISASGIEQRYNTPSIFNTLYNFRQN